MVHWLRHMVLMLALAGLFCSCTQIEDARHVVAEADSLRAVGTTYDDSLAIAKAAATLSHVRSLYPTDYAHANYYYGRILRDHGDQPAAMLAFLNVIHSRTEDHEIKARSYSNIANMCRLASEHKLACELSGFAATEFLCNHDTLLYYYALNDQAYDLAEDSVKDKAIALTNKIESACKDFNVLIKIWETRADAYINVQMYDSALYCLRRLHACGNQEPYGMLLLARVFEYTGKIDSALFYAKRVFEESAYYGDRYNALYILSHYDSTLTIDEALTLTSEREDVRLKEYEPVKVKLTQAVQILQQDLNRRPNLTWLWSILVTILVISTPSYVYISHKRKKRQLISQQTEELLQKNEQLAQHAIQLQSAHSEYEEKVKLDVKLFCQNVLANPDPKQAICWGNYEQMCEIINTNMFGLATKLEDLNLAGHEIEFCVLVLLQLSRKECAEWMHLGESSMGGKKRDTAKKLGQKSANLYDFLLSLACK